MERKQTLLAYLLETPNFLSIFLYPIFLISISSVLLDISNELYIKLDSLNASHLPSLNLFSGKFSSGSFIFVRTLFLVFKK